MAAVAMPRGRLIGVRFSEEELARIERLIAHYEAANPGVAFTAQTVIKASLALAEKHLGVIPPPPGSKPRRKR